MNEEMWGFMLILLSSTGPVTDVDLNPQKVGIFQTQAACESAGKKLQEQQLVFAQSLNKATKVRSHYLCVDQRPNP